MKTKLVSVTIAITLFASAFSASAQFYGFGCPITPMGAAIQAQSMAIQQATAQIMSQIASQTVTPIGYVPTIPVTPTVGYVPVTSSCDSYESQSYQSNGYISVDCSYESDSHYDYQAGYRRWENQARSVYESMTLGGYTDSRGGHSNLDDLPAGGYGQYQQLLRSAQKEMRTIRAEAASAGINIPQSSWETVTVDCY